MAFVGAMVSCDAKGCEAHISIDVTPPPGDMGALLDQARRMAAEDGWAIGLPGEARSRWRDAPPPGFEVVRSVVYPGLDLCPRHKPDAE